MFRYNSCSWAGRTRNIPREGEFRKRMDGAHRYRQEQERYGGERKLARVAMRQGRFVPLGGEVTSAVHGRVSPRSIRHESLGTAPLGT